MLLEIRAESPGLVATICGVNGAGLEAGNDAMCAGRALPWLQDEAGVDVWTRWDVAFRDVVVCDAANRVHAIFNLTTHDLADPASYAALKALIVQAAGEP